MRVLFSAPEALWPQWQPALRHACPEARFLREGEPETIDAILHAPGGPVEDFAPYHNARIVQSLWAGVERIITNPTLTQPLARMVDPGLARGMAEYCTGWVMRAHLGMDLLTQDGVWRNNLTPPLAPARRVGILGTGELGQAVAASLSAMGFDLAAANNSGRQVEGLRVMDLDALLARSEILITLLPDTPRTRNLLDATRLATLPAGATIINPGRGTLIDDAALLAALERGHLARAVLDVFQSEPLPPDHPFWAHPRVIVTSHTAAATRPETAAPVIAENLRRARDGRPILYLVDHVRGY